MTVSLTKPAEGSVGWSSAINQNFTDIETALNQGSLPSGAIVMYGGSESSDPSGWLLCDGRAVSRSTYSALFTAIGTTYGVGDGSTTFNIPDLRARSPIGVNNSSLPGGANGSFSTRNRAATGGAETVTLSTSEIPSHNHRIDTDDSGLGSALASRLGSNVYSGAGFYTANAGGGGAHNNMHPFNTVNFMIKT